MKIFEGNSKKVIFAFGAILKLFLLTGMAFSQPMVKNLWVVKAVDTVNYTPAYLGNGMVGLRGQLSGLGAGKVIINGLYDRSPTGENVRLINYFNPMNIHIIFNDGKELVFGDKVKAWQQSLNLKEGSLETSYEYAGELKIKTTMTALRNLPMAAMNVYEFEAIENIDFSVQSIMSIPDRSNTSGIFKTAFGYNMYRLNTTTKDKIPVMSATFPTESGTDCVAGANTFYFEGKVPELQYTKSSATRQQLSFKVILKKGEKYSFSMLSAFTHSSLTTDVHNDVVRICSRDYNLGYRGLLAGHKAAWAKLWESDIVIEGDDEAQVDARLALYSLYASSSSGFGLSVPPCGLAETGWGGHIFWDAELWMFPPLLIMQPAFARSMIDFRLNTLPQAKRRAAQFGYSGAMYPWESDLQGNECTPISYKLDMNEHHVTADVAIAAFNYYKITGDKLWLQQKGFPLIKEIADFWVSRAVKDSGGKYHIKNVVGPDEYHEDVDDDAFTNAAAKMVLDAAVTSAALVNAAINSEWKVVRDRIVILQHKDGYTLQSAQYKGERIKQADVNLLAFPLESIIDKNKILKDLQYYEPKIDPNGPSMSYSILATSYARFGQTAKAYSLFQKAYQPNRKAPFGFISEKPSASASVFCTGYGGMLQTVLFGFAGLKIRDDGLYFGIPNLPPHWKKLTIKRSGKKDVVCLPTISKGKNEK